MRRNRSRIGCAPVSTISIRICADGCRRAAADDARSNRRCAIAACARGKRIRPAIIFALGDALGAARREMLDAACAVELVHCCSLIHDDLPCMDDDDWRRNRPACHIRFGEGQALLAGIALQALAFDILAQSTLPSESVSHLAHAAGVRGICGGQSFDLQGEHTSLAMLRRTHQLKTGSLFQCCIALALLGASAQQRKKHTARANEFAHHFGLLFQIGNDLVDFNRDRKSDADSYVSLLGAERTIAQLKRHRRRALAITEELSITRLSEITRFIADGAIADPSAAR